MLEVWCSSQPALVRCRRLNTNALLCAWGATGLCSAKWPAAQTGPAAALSIQARAEATFYRKYTSSRAMAAPSRQGLRPGAPPRLLYSQRSGRQASKQSRPTWRADALPMRRERHADGRLGLVRLHWLPRQHHRGAGGGVVLSRCRGRRPAGGSPAAALAARRPAWRRPRQRRRGCRLLLAVLGGPGGGGHVHAAASSVVVRPASLHSGQPAAGRALALRRLRRAALRRLRHAALAAARRPPALRPRRGGARLAGGRRHQAHAHVGVGRGRRGLHGGQRGRGCGLDGVGVRRADLRLDVRLLP